jgi:hypothetical protein
VASYLAALRPILTTASDDRREFLRLVGTLVQGARDQNEVTVAHAAGKIGKEQGVVFKRTRFQLGRLTVPPPCEKCHESVAGWLDTHVDACKVMLEVGHSIEMARLREAQTLLAEGRKHAHAFNYYYNHLVAELRRRVDAAAKAPKKKAAPAAPADRAK